MRISVQDFYNYCDNIFNYLANLSMYISPTFLKMLTIYFIIKYIIFNIALYFILIKENKKAYKAFIPIVNIIEFSNIVHIPFMIFFIPVLNLFAIVFSPYKLFKQYRYNSLNSFFSIFLPDIFIILLAFGNHTNKDVRRNENYIRSLTDLEELDQKMIKKNNEVKKTTNIKLFRFIKDFKDKYNYPDWKHIKKVNNTIEEKINTIENSVKNSPTYDELVLDTDDIQVNENREKYIVEEVKEEIIDENIDTVEALEEEKVDQSIKSLDKINEIEKDQIKNEKQSTNVDTNDYKDYKGIQKSDIAIAFGSKQQDEELAKQKNDMKINKHVCPKCGASLVGAKDYCPGCNTPISQLFSKEETIEEI